MFWDFSYFYRKITCRQQKNTRANYIYTCIFFLSQEIAKVEPMLLCNKKQWAFLNFNT